jgi:hypothetical protein
MDLKTLIVMDSFNPNPKSEGKPSSNSRNISQKILGPIPPLEVPAKTFLHFRINA